MGSLLAPPRFQNKLSSIATEQLSITPTNRPKPGPSNPLGNSLTVKSPTQVLGSPVNPQATSFPSHRQTTNQATGSDNRGPGKTQLLPSSVKSSSGLSTKARIATDMAKGLASFGQSKPKYQGLSMRKNTNPPGELRSPVIPSTANPQPPLEPSQQTSLPRSSSGHNDLANQTQVREASSPQLSPPPPPPPQPEEPIDDPEPDRMDTNMDQPEFVDFLHFYSFSNLLQPALHSLSNQRTLQQRRTCFTR